MAYTHDPNVRNGISLNQITTDSYAMTIRDPFDGTYLMQGIFSLSDLNQSIYWTGKTREQIEGDKVAKLY